MAEVAEEGRQGLMLFGGEVSLHTLSTAHPEHCTHPWHCTHPRHCTHPCHAPLARCIPSASRAYLPGDHAVRGTRQPRALARRTAGSLSQQSRRSHLTLSHTVRHTARPRCKGPHRHDRSDAFRLACAARLAPTGGHRRAGPPRIPAARRVVVSTPHTDPGHVSLRLEPRPIRQRPDEAGSAQGPRQRNLASAAAADRPSPG